MVVATACNEIRGNRTRSKDLRNRRSNSDCGKLCRRTQVDSRVQFIGIDACFTGNLLLNDHGVAILVADYGEEIDPLRNLVDQREDIGAAGLRIERSKNSIQVSRRNMSHVFTIAQRHTHNPCLSHIQKRYELRLKRKRYIRSISSGRGPVRPSSPRSSSSILRI